jgi:hypothetical protein
MPRSVRVAHSLRSFAFPECLCIGESAAMAAKRELPATPLLPDSGACSAASSTGPRVRPAPWWLTDGDGTLVS